MGGTCNTYGRDQKCVQHLRKPEDRIPSGDLGVDRKTVLKLTLKEQSVRRLTRFM
jgi:hypothetical protein